MIGQHCIISDSEMPEASVNGHPPAAKPIEIGAEAWLAGRVTVRPGVTIGEGAVITAGSIVETDIPPRVVAGGISVRVLRSTDGAARSGQDGAASAGTRAPMMGTPVAAAISSTEAKAPAAPHFRGPSFRISPSTSSPTNCGSDASPGVGVTVAPFGQVTQVLLEEPQEGASDFLVVWTRPETTIGSFGRTLGFENIDENELFAEVDAFCSLVEQAAPRYKFVFVPTWTLSSWTRGLGMLDGRKGGVARQLMAMNLRLSDNLSKTSNVFVMNAERWGYARDGGRGEQPQGLVPGQDGHVAPCDGRGRRRHQGSHRGARRRRAQTAGRRPRRHHVGRDRRRCGLGRAPPRWSRRRGRGLRRLSARGEEPEEAWRYFRHRSKNEESTALEAIRRHPEMVLQEDDFVGWRINWVDKAQNIAELAVELNLGLQSVVFIDDNPVERARVREALPEVSRPRMARRQAALP